MKETLENKCEHEKEYIVNLKICTHETAKIYEGKGFFNTGNPFCKYQNTFGGYVLCTKYIKNEAK